MDTDDGGLSLSLLQPIQPAERTGIREDGDGEEDQKVVAAATVKSNEEKLQNELFILKKINSSFGVYHEALEGTQSATEVRLMDVERRSCNLLYWDVFSGWRHSWNRRMRC